MLGEGNYAQVKLSKEKSTGHMWAIKIINKKKLEVRCPPLARCRRPAACALCPCSACAARQRANGVPPFALAQPGDEEMLALEVEVLREVSHPNIIHLYKCVFAPPPCNDCRETSSLRAERCGRRRVFDTKYKMFMVLELVTGGELLERCPPSLPPSLLPARPPAVR